MRLLVRYTAQLRAALNKSEEEVELSGSSTVAEVLARIASRCTAEASTHLLTPAGGLQPSLLVVLNSEIVSAAAAESVEVKPGDVLTLMPPIAGG